jgi:hypothetical protein
MPTTPIPMNLPCSSHDGTSIRAPPLVIKKGAQSCSQSRQSAVPYDKNFCTPLLKSSVMNSLTRKCNIASMLLYPTNLMAHSLVWSILAKSIKQVVYSLSLSWARQRNILSNTNNTNNVTLIVTVGRSIQEHIQTDSRAFVMSGNSKKLAVSSTCPCKASSRTACRES